MSDTHKSLNFLEQIVEDDLANGYTREQLRFRFPPEPNGYLHIGHCKAICISFGLGEKYNAPVNLRFDDTNPSKEDQEYVDAIMEDVKWLGFDWEDREFFASDYLFLSQINNFKCYIRWSERGAIFANLSTTYFILKYLRTDTYNII